MTTTLKGDTTIYNPVFWSEVHFSDKQDEDWHGMPNNWKNISRRVHKWDQDKRRDGFYSIGCKQLINTNEADNWYASRHIGCKRLYSDLKNANPDYLDAVKIMSDKSPFKSARQRDQMNEALYSTSDFVSTRNVLNHAHFDWGLLGPNMDMKNVSNIIENDYIPAVYNKNNEQKTVLVYDTHSHTGIPNTFAEDDHSFRFYLKKNSEQTVYDIEPTSTTEKGVRFRPTKIGKACPNISGLTLKNSLWNSSDVIGEKRSNKIIQSRVDKSTRANPSIECTYSYNKNTPSEAQIIAKKIKDADLTGRHYNPNKMSLVDNKGIRLDPYAEIGSDLVSLEEQLLTDLCSNPNYYGVVVTDRETNSNKNCLRYLRHKGKHSQDEQEANEAGNYCAIDYKYDKNKKTATLNITDKNKMPACAVNNIINFEQKVREIGPNESIIGHYELVKKKYPNTADAPPGFKEVFEWMDGIPKKNLESLKEHLTVGTIPCALCYTKLDPLDIGPEIFKYNKQIDCNQDIQICDIDVKLSDIQVGGDLDLENECKATPPQTEELNADIEVNEDKVEDDEDDEDDEDNEDDEDDEEYKEAKKSVRESTTKTKAPNMIVVLVFILIIVALIYFGTRKPTPPQ